ncbi:MAG: hypothetical protein WC046_06775 [Candidatus Bathyarchaeia archaeon]
MSENKLNLIMAVRGYKNPQREKKSFGLDVTATDSLDRKVLLRIIDPLANEYISIRDIKNLESTIEKEHFDSAILISKQFTDAALEEMNKQKIQYASDDYMPPFDIQDLYLAIVNSANNKCQKKCGKVLIEISNCGEKVGDLCKVRAVAKSAKNHFEDGNIGLLKNDLKMVLSLNR